MRTHLWNSNKQKSFWTNDSKFLCKIGHISTIPHEDRETVTADWFVSHCLPQVFQPWRIWHPQMGVHGQLLSLWHCRVHMVTVTLKFQAASDVQFATHPPYSPYVTPCDSFLSPSIKGHWSKSRFRALKMPEHSGRVSIWTHPSQHGWMS